MKMFKRFPRRSPLWPALLSALVAPGAGQIANRDFTRGVFLLVVSLGGFFWFSSVLTEQLARFLQGTPDMWKQDPMALNNALAKVVAENPSMYVTFFVLMMITWTFGVVDAYLSAKNKPLTPEIENETSDAER